jgi:threonyl-tRNA synthetase
MNLPERFDLFCTNEEGKEERIVMLHAAIMGSIERFSSVMIEHTAGAFPAWLSPEQVRIIPISDQNNAYGEKIAGILKGKGFRIVLDTEKERMQNKIRKAQAFKVPYMLILGKNEEANETVSLRYRSGEEIKDLKLADLIKGMEENISARKLDIKLS